MFANSYFGKRYFPASYFPSGGVVTVVSPDYAAFGLDASGSGVNFAAIG